MKFSISIRHIRKATKTLKIGTNSLKIKHKKKDCTTANAKNIIFLFWVFYVFM